MTKKQAIDKTIKHWEEMIKFAEGVPIDISNFDLMWKMDTTIGQYWCSLDCPLCSKYLKLIKNKAVCKKCPLELAGKGCGLDSSPWRHVSDSKNVKEWLVNAKNMLEVLRSLK